MIFFLFPPFWRSETAFFTLLLADKRSWQAYKEKSQMNYFMKECRISVKRRAFG